MRLLFWTGQCHDYPAVAGQQEIVCVEKVWTRIIDFADNGSDSSISYSPSDLAQLANTSICIREGFGLPGTQWDAPSRLANGHQQSTLLSQRGKFHSSSLFLTSLSRQQSEQAIHIYQPHITWQAMNQHVLECCFVLMATCHCAPFAEYSQGTLLPQWLYILVSLPDMSHNTKAMFDRSKVVPYLVKFFIQAR